MRKPGSYVKQKRGPDQPNPDCPAMKGRKARSEADEVDARRGAQKKTPAETGKSEEVSDA